MERGEGGGVVGAAQRRFGFVGWGSPHGEACIEPRLRPASWPGTVRRIYNGVSEGLFDALKDAGVSDPKLVLVREHLSSMPKLGQRHGERTVG